MGDEVSKRHASAWLTSHGFDVDPIPRASEKRADLKATWNGEEYAVESKGKAETSFWRNLLAAAREQGMAADSRLILSWNTVSGVVRDAYDQLQATPLSDGTFRILWVLAAQGDSVFVLEAFERRLFGTVVLSCISSIQSTPQVKKCYYHGYSDFLRFPNLDAAVLLTGDNHGILCVNSFSPRRQALRRGRLHRIFHGFKAVRDPEVEDKLGEALVVDSPVASGGRNAFLQRKYGLGTSVMLESQFAGFVWVDLAKLGG